MVSIDAQLREVCVQFRIPGEYVGHDQIKVGNINKTYRVDYKTEQGKPKSYIVQNVNTNVFKKPEQVMENIDRVTTYVRENFPEAGALHFHHLADGKNFLINENGFWRLCNFLDARIPNDQLNEMTLHLAGTAFGEFQMMLADFDAASLYATIPDFHNTRKRFETLFADAERDAAGRVHEVQAELAALRDMMDQASILTDMEARGELPLRVTHNDTKVNNVLFDCAPDGKHCVIDLDTVMPGLVGHDFGDAARFGTNEVDEDCPEYDRSVMNLDRLRALADGFLSKTAKTLTEAELDTLAYSPFVMTAELVARFLDDYINGDVYFKINYPEHNIVRTRCQLALAQDMLKKMPETKAIIREAAAKYLNQ